MYKVLQKRRHNKKAKKLTAFTKSQALNDFTRSYKMQMILYCIKAKKIQNSIFR